MTTADLMAWGSVFPMVVFAVVAAILHWGDETTLVARGWSRLQSMVRYVRFWCRSSYSRRYWLALQIRDLTRRFGESEFEGETWNGLVVGTMHHWWGPIGVHYEVIDEEWDATGSMVILFRGKEVLLA